jgi:hypothetical protein
VATIAVLQLLPEKQCYPKLGAYPKYGDFTLMATVGVEAQHFEY